MAFSVFRILFGTYLLIHFLQLIPYGTELFSNVGLLADPSLNPAYGAFPNPLYFFDDPWMITATLLLGCLASTSFTLGYARKISALVLWFTLAALFHRNNLIANPSLPYVNLILILTLLIPKGEPWSLSRKHQGLNTFWSLPHYIPGVATLLLALGYSFSGYTKLFSPSWIDGTALIHVLENPLARPGMARDALLSIPEPLLKLATWGALLSELLYLPLIYLRKTRLWIWLTLVCMHLSLIFLIDFADLSIGMVMIHLFTFNPRWLPTLKTQQGHLHIGFDSDCLMCNRFLHFLTQRDYADLMRFEALPDTHPKKSILVLKDDCLYTRSSAVLIILKSLGGWWRGLATLIWFIPKPLRDLAYILVAKHRHRFFRNQHCPMPSRELRQRISKTPVFFKSRNLKADCSLKQKTRKRTLRWTLLLILSTGLIITLFPSCSTAPLHHGRFPFSMLERPQGGNHLHSKDAAFIEVTRHHATASSQERTAKLARVQPGDVIAFHMSHAEAMNYLKQGTIQKIPYEVFRYGHLALVVQNPEAPSQLRLLQLAMNQAANIDSDLSYLTDKYWVLYRPTRPLNLARLNEFVLIALERASDSRKAYDYSGALGLINVDTSPQEANDIKSEYTCVTLIEAALHYAGHPIRATRRKGLLDVVTPAQLIRGKKIEKTNK